MKKLTFIQNTIILVLSNLVTGALTFIFSIILSREIGAQGVGLYQIVMPVYTLFICFTCGGVTTALSKIVSEQNSRKNTSELYRSVSYSIAFFSFWTILISIIAAAIAPLISAYFLKDVRTYTSILVFIPALLFVAIGSVLKGYFYGLQNTVFPAVIDIVEKAVRIIVLITLVTGLKPYGLKYQVSGAVAAMTAGELTSFILLYAFYKKSCWGVKQLTGKPDNAAQIIANVLSISLPLCLNGFLSTLLGTFVAVMVPRRLQSIGYTLESSLALYGKIVGMGFNIIMFPAIIIGAISTILVPVISEASAGRGMSSVNRKMHAALKLTAAISAVSSGLFFTIPDELGKLFYSRPDLGNIIFSLSFGIIFSYIEATLFGILNGLGKQKVLLKNTIIMSIIDIVSLYLLIGMPGIGIYGYGINFVISPFVGCLLNTYEINRSTDAELKLGKIMAYPALITGIEIIILSNIKPVVFKIIPSFNTATVVLILGGISIYGIFYCILKPVLYKS
jgi:stage V sporulation protein B